MRDFEFTIPLQKEELLESHAGQYHVEDVIHPRFLLNKLQDAMRTFDSEGVEFILENFDIYFSLLVHGSKLEWNVLNKGFQHIEKIAVHLCSHLEVIFADQEIIDEVRRKNLNIVNMLMYLYTQIMKAKDVKLATENSTKLTLGKKNKKATDDEELCGWAESDKRAALETLYLVLQQPLSQLWDPPLADHNFVTMVSEPCYKAIEEHVIKNKSLRETVFQILGVLIKKYNHGNACIIKLVQLLQMSEHAVLPICAGIVQLTKDFGLSTFAPQMVREIAEALADSEVDNGIGTEQGVAKNCGVFLMELTKLLPKEMTSAIAAIETYLDTDEWYTLRISVLGMMCEVVIVELSGEELSNEQRVKRDEFLDNFYEHMHDVSAYVRHKVLQYWSRLQRENAVPVNRLPAVLERSVDRLKDKSALVRKAALQLLKTFVEYNPYSGQLKLEEIEKHLQSEQKILDELSKKMKRPGPDPALIKKWEKIEDDVIAVIKENLDSQTPDEEELSQASLTNLFDAIRKHVHDKNYYKAYLVVKHAEKEYPEVKILRSNLQKNDQMNYFVDLLHNIYVTPSQDQLLNPCEKELALQKRVEEKENLVAFLQDSLHFSKTISGAMPLINTLLHSKLTGDVSEAIEFLTTAHKFNIESAKVGVVNMLSLTWSQDQEKRAAVEKAYREMYLEGESGRSERGRAVAAAMRLTKLVSELTVGAAQALERLVAAWLQREELTPAHIQVFWEIFLKKIDGTSEDDSRAALAMLMMISHAKPSVARANMGVLETHGLTGGYKTRVLTVQLLKSIADNHPRYPEEHSIFATTVDSVTEAFNSFTNFESFAAGAIDFMYAACDTPDVPATTLLVKLSDSLQEATVAEEGSEDEVTTPVELLKRFVFVLGQVAYQQLVYLDVTVYSELRRRNQVREERKTEKNANKEKKEVTPARRRGGPPVHPRQAALVNVSNSSASSRALRRTPALATPTSNNTSMMTEEDGAEGMEGAMADDADAEYVRTVCERDIVAPGTTLGQYMPLLRSLLQQPSTPTDLQTSAALTYTRFMLVSSSVCEEGMQLILTLLKRSKNVALRTNIITSFGDLTLRFTNITQPWTSHIYDVLIDDSVEVRKCAVAMLSYLMLHEMVRVKGQIADVALRCVDDDASVAGLARLFFRLLSHKGNALYNVMPDIISRLSDPGLAVPEQQFRDTMKFITPLILKDRQMEALVEKLCQRFKLSTEERQWRDLAYCLSLFTYNERCLRKLIENIDFYKDKLHCDGVMECFNSIMSSASKNVKNEVKSLVTELGDKIEECFAVRDGDKEEEKRSSPSTPLHPRNTPARRPAARRNRRRSSDSSDENEAPNRVDTPQSVRKSSRRAATRVISEAVNNSDESDDDDFEKKRDDVFKKPATRKPIRRRK